MKFEPPDPHDEDGAGRIYDERVEIHMLHSAECDGTPESCKRCEQAELIELEEWSDSLPPDGLALEEARRREAERANAGCTCNRVGLCERCQEAKRILSSGLPSP